MQFPQYLNVHAFATEWRGYQPQPSFKLYELEEFRKQMQASQYVCMKYLNRFDKPVQIFLLSPTSKYMNNQTLKQLLVKISDPTDVILITEQPLKKHAYGHIGAFKHLRVNVYLQRYFDIIMPKAPLVGQHRILSQAEVIKLLNDELRTSLINLPKILVEDVQCIWIGAEVGDVIEIRNLSDIAGESVTNRVVVPKSGRVISFRQEAVAPTEEKIDEEKEEIDRDEDANSVVNDESEEEES